MSSSFAEVRARMATSQLATGRLHCAPLPCDAKHLQNLFIISTAAPLVPRPDLSHSLRRGSRKVPQREQER